MVGRSGIGRCCRSEGVGCVTKHESLFYTCTCTVFVPSLMFGAVMFGVVLIIARFQHAVSAPPAGEHRHSTVMSLVISLLCFTV